MTEQQPDVDPSPEPEDDPDGYGHIRSHRVTLPLSPWARRFAFIVLACAAAVTAVAMTILWPADGPATTDGAPSENRISAQVIAVEMVPCPEPPPDLADVVRGPCGTVTLRLGAGAQSGQVVSGDIPSGPGAPVVEPGDKVVVLYTPDTFAGSPYQIIDHERGQQMWALVITAALVIVAFARWRGAAALAGLAVTFAILLLFVVPAILNGSSALLVAIVGSAAIMLVVLYLTHGFNVSTSVALLGILSSLTLTGLLAAVTATALHLTGVASEEANFLTIDHQDVNMQGLLLAGIIIGALGVLDDVAITQAATVNELAAANQALTGRQLYRAAARVGRSHIASVINTIVLAYVGASLPLLLLLAGARASLGEVLTSQLLAEEIVRTVVGTMGLLAAVPITTALAAFTARRLAPQSSEGDGSVPRKTNDSARRRTGWLESWDSAEDNDWPAPSGPGPTPADPHPL